MDAEEQRLEVEPAHADDDDLAVDDTALGQRRGEGCDELGEVTVHRLLVAALQHDLVAVAKHQCSKAVPLGLELPAVAARQGVRGFGQHGHERRSEGQAHSPILAPRDTRACALTVDCALRAWHAERGRTSCGTHESRVGGSGPRWRSRRWGSPSTAYGTG